MYSIEADLNWVRSHVLTIIVLAVLIFGGVYYFNSRAASAAAANDSKWQSILAQQVKQTEALQSQLNSNEEKWSAANSSLLSANQTLAASVLARATQLSTNAAKNANLPPSDVAIKLRGAANGDDIILPLPIGRDLATSLDTLAATQADLADTKTQLANEITVAENLQSNLTEEQKLLSALRTQSEIQEKACKASVADLKSQIRKGRLKWWGIGFLSGLIAGRIL